VFYKSRRVVVAVNDRVTAIVDDCGGIINIAAR
jgi:hypothetical protein